MPAIRLIAVFAALSVFTGPAIADDALANRYQMEKTENGFVRLDTVTGEMSLCVERDGAIVCGPAADGGTTSSAALEARVKRLEERIEALESASRNDLPDDAEIDRAVGAMQKFMRGFFGMVEELRKDFDSDRSAPELAPQRT